jgi:hypothetical protein
MLKALQPAVPSRKRRQEAPLRDLIDVKVQLHQDADRLDEDERDAQDRRIAHEISAADIQPPALYQRWLEKRSVRSASGDSPGQVVEKAYELTTFILTLAGFVGGWLLVWGWLTHDQSRPTNVIHFVAVVAGIPFLLVVGWCLAALPRRWLAWLPGIRVLGYVGLAWAWLWRISRRALSRFAGEHREAMPEVGRWLKANGRLSFWLIARLSHAAGAAFALGAILALVASFYLTDPALGWRSRLLSDTQVYSVTQAVATPWTAFAPGAMAPSRQQIQRTRYSSLGLRYASAAKAGGSDGKPWSAWWSFALMAILVYALIPRLAGLGFVTWGYKRALRRAWRFDRELNALRSRLQNPLAIRSGPMGAAATAAVEPKVTNCQAAAPSATQRCQVLQWSGVELEPEAVRTWLARRLGVDVAGIRCVGARVQADREALDELRSAQEADQHILLLIHGRDEPVIDHREFLRQLREAIGAEAAVTIVLCASHEGDPTPLERECERQWRRVARSFGANLVAAPVLEGAR